MKESWGKREGAFYQNGSSMEAGTLFGSQLHVKITCRPEYCLRRSSGIWGPSLQAVACTQATPPWGSDVSCTPPKPGPRYPESFCLSLGPVR